MIVFDGCLMLCIYDALPFVHVPGVYNAHYSNEYLCLQAAVFHLAAPLGACTHTRTNTCTHIHTPSYTFAQSQQLRVGNRQEEVKGAMLVVVGMWVWAWVLGV